MPEFREIEGETSRTYYFDNTKIKIDRVIKEATDPGGRHLLETVFGKKWIIDYTWEAIEIEASKWS